MLDSQQRNVQSTHAPSYSSHLKLQFWPPLCQLFKRNQLLLQESVGVGYASSDIHFIVIMLEGVAEAKYKTL